MRFLTDARNYWHIRNGSIQPTNSIPNGAQHTYKPKAIRIPALTSLFLLFAICLIWLEILMDKTIDRDQYYNDRDSFHLPSKRQEQNTCPIPAVASESLTSLDQQHSSLCDEYTISIKPFTTDLSGAAAARFDTWLTSYSSMEAESTSLEACGSSAATLSSLSSLLESQTPLTPLSLTPSATNATLSPTSSIPDPTTSIQLSTTSTTSATFDLTNTTSSSTTTTTSTLTTTSSSTQTTTTTSLTTTTRLFQAGSTTARNTTSLTTTRLFQASPTTTTTSNATTTTTPPAECTQPNQPCSSCDAEACYCQQLAARKYGKRQDDLYCTSVNACKCKMNEETGVYDCYFGDDSVDFCSTTSIASTTQTTSVSETTTTIAQDVTTSSITQDITTTTTTVAFVTVIQSACAIENQSCNTKTTVQPFGTGTTVTVSTFTGCCEGYSCGGSETTCEPIATTTSSTTTTTTTATTTTTTTTSTAETPSTCSRENSPCTGCGADMCSCQMEFDDGVNFHVACMPDNCHCQQAESGGEWTCGDFDLCQEPCSGPYSEGQPCPRNEAQTCSSNDCLCESSTCVNRYLPCNGNQKLGASCEGCGTDDCVCSWDGVWQNRCTPACTDCGAEKCVKNDQTCIVNTCYCNGYECGTEDTCTLVSGECDGREIDYCYYCDTWPEYCYCTGANTCEPMRCTECWISYDPNYIICADQRGEGGCTPPPNTVPPGNQEKRDLSSDVFGLASFYNETLDAFPRDHPRARPSSRQAGYPSRRNASHSELHEKRAMSNHLKSHVNSQHGGSRRIRNLWDAIERRDGDESLPLDFETPIPDAWNYLLWTSDLEVRRTSGSVVTTTVAATFTLDVFEGGSTSWPTLTTTPPLLIQPTKPGCIPVTIIQPAPGFGKRGEDEDQSVLGIEAYVSRDSTTVTIGIRDNYLLLTSDLPTITISPSQPITSSNAKADPDSPAVVVSGSSANVQSGSNDAVQVVADPVVQTLANGVVQTIANPVVQTLPNGIVQTVANTNIATTYNPNAAVAMTTMTMEIESVNAHGARETQSVVVVRPITGVIGKSDNAALIDLSHAGSGSGSGSGYVSGSGSGSGSNYGHNGGAGSGSGKDDTQEHSQLETLKKNERVVATKFTMVSYFTALYLPGIAAVAIKILFETMVASIKMMEPFERLHRSQGATAEDSICSQYLSSSLSSDVFRSISSGRSIPLWTLILYIAITIAAPISASSMMVRPMDFCTIGGVQRLCDPKWIIDVRFIRTMEALLVVCLVITVILTWDSWRYHAGVPSNPSSIVAMAVLLNYEPLRYDLQTIGPEDSEEVTAKVLNDYHFWLTPHNPSRTQARYGIVHAPETETNQPGVSTGLFGHNFVNLESRYNSVLSKITAKQKSKILDNLHIFITSSLLILLMTYLGDRRTDAFNNFFASGRTGPRFLLVSMATVLDMQWKNLEREVRITDPYRRLHFGNARPENTILCTLNGTCWSNAPGLLSRFFRYQHMWFETLIGITAVLSDINIIAVSGVPRTNASTIEAEYFSMICSVTITSIMLIVLTITKFWWRRTKVISEMPRIPETIGSVLSYLCTSRMAADLAAMGMETLSAQERDEIILSKNYRYKFDKMMGEDGQERWCVDYDDDGDGKEGAGDRDSWVKTKMERPAAVRMESYESCNESK